MHHAPYDAKARERRSASRRGRALQHGGLSSRRGTRRSPVSVRRGDPAISHTAMVNAERRQRPGLGWLALIALALTLVLPPVAVSIAPDPPVAATLPTAATGTYRVY